MNLNRKDIAAAISQPPPPLPPAAALPGLGGISPDTFKNGFAAAGGTRRPLARMTASDLGLVLAASSGPRPATPQGGVSYVSHVKGQSPVKDQKDRQTCASFATIAAMEAILWADGTKVSLSEQYAIRVVPFGQPCVEAVDIVIMAQGVQAAPICAESFDQYFDLLTVRRNGACTVPATAAARAAAIYQIGSFREVANVQDPAVLEDLLRQGSNIVLEIEVISPDAMPTFSEVQPDSAGHPVHSGNKHALLVVGYDRRGTTPPVFICKNSYGPTAGSKGYYFLSYDYVSTYAIKGVVVGAVVTLPMPAAVPAPVQAPPAAAMAPAARATMASAISLSQLVGGGGTLSSTDRALIVRQALVLFDQNYAHLPLKQAMHGVDPVQRLKVLQRSLADPELTDPLFHREMTEIFTSVRDLHTVYLLPAPYHDKAAVLPFMVEEFFDQGERRYLVSHVVEGFARPPFDSGVEILTWNGLPVERAVAVNAEGFAGSNLAARHARGVQALTTRMLMMAPPPDEEWVVVGYRTADGAQQGEARFDWQVVQVGQGAQGAGAGGGAHGGAHAHLGAAASLGVAALLGVDLEQDRLKRLRKVLFAPEVAALEGQAIPLAAPLDSNMPEVFEAREVPAAGGAFGYLRIRTFEPDPAGDAAVDPVGAFSRELLRLLPALPQRGLIVDVRGNGGGYIACGEMALQTLTPRQIEPEPFQLRNTALNLALSAVLQDLAPWQGSMQEGVLTGATFSAGYGLTGADDANAIGQRYFGPVVLIVDALCYSTTDIFAAGFQDHGIGTVLGTDANTGAGGANVWYQSQLQAAFPGAASGYEPLPGAAAMTVALRRSLRVGRRGGSPLEDLGVAPDEAHPMTRDDLLHDNVDLIRRACELLAAQTGRTLKVTAAAEEAKPGLQVRVEATGMSSVDVYLGGRPVGSAALAAGVAQLSVSKRNGAPVVLEVQGFDGDELVARLVQSI